MRKVSCKHITEAIETLCISTNIKANPDLIEALGKSILIEKSPRGREILSCLIENSDIAYERKIPLCQDTGMVVVFVEIGQEVHITDGILGDAINEGVRRGYLKGCLRKSVVADPLLRQNTGDNTPAIVHYTITPGDKIKIIVAPKGFGSENMSDIKMLPPSAGIEGVMDFIVDTVDKAGSNPCPPIVVGVGIGGTFEKAALLSKRALLRRIGEKSSMPHIAEIEEKLLKRINSLGIGPGGLGGTITALTVAVEIFATHIAGLPVAINIGCHATRHGEVII